MRDGRPPHVFSNSRSSSGKESLDYSGRHSYHRTFGREDGDRVIRRENGFNSRCDLKASVNTSRLVVILAIVSLIAGAESHSQSAYFPPLSGTSWDTVSPASLGWCPDRIDTLINFLAANGTRAFIVLKDGRIALEQYFGTFTRDSLWYWASAGKSLTAFIVGIAQQEGLLSLGDSTSRYLGVGWTSCTPEQEGLITVLNQLTMTSGLDDLVPDNYCTLPGCLVYKADAGTRWAYHTAPYTLLDSVIENASGQPLFEYFSAKLRSHIGMNGLWVQSGYNHVYVSTARSMARFGLLALNRGMWGADTILADTSYFRRMTTSSQSLNPSYGYLWWLNGKGSYMIPQVQIVFPGSWAPNAPADMIAALGKNGQFMNIVPSQGLVMVRMGEAPDSSYDVPMQFDNDIWVRLSNLTCTQTGAGEPAPAAQFTLEQNFPNPFNPSTTIRFHLVSAAHVSLKLFDELGRDVSTLIDGRLSAGTHERHWDAAGLASGAYFFRLQAGSTTVTKRLVLIR